MRNIKFRVYSKKYRVMEHCETIKELYDVTHNNKDRYLEERENILMQFTGMLDKNGKEIYEGDILGRPHINVPIQYYRVSIPEIYELGSSVFSIFSSEWEIVGNIYENPDLLSPQKYI